MKHQIDKCYDRAAVRQSFALPGCTDLADPGELVPSLEGLPKAFQRPSNGLLKGTAFKRSFASLLKAF